MLGIKDKANEAEEATGVWMCGIWRLFQDKLRISVSVFWSLDQTLSILLFKCRYIIRQSVVLFENSAVASGLCIQCLANVFIFFTFCYVVCLMLNCFILPPSPPLQSTLHTPYWQSKKQNFHNFVNLLQIKTSNKYICISIQAKYLG